MNQVKLTLAGKRCMAIYVPKPFAVEDLGAWHDSTARVNRYPQAMVYWSGANFAVQETAEEILELLAK